MEEKSRERNGEQELKSLRNLRIYLNGEFDKISEGVNEDSAKMVQYLLELRRKFQGIIPYFCLELPSKDHEPEAIVEIKVENFSFPKLPPVDYLKHLIKD